MRQMYVISGFAAAHFSISNPEPCLSAIACRLAAAGTLNPRQRACEEFLWNRPETTRSEV